MINRRQFVQTGMGAAAASALPSYSPASQRRILGSNADLRVAVIGIRGRGNGLIGSVKRARGMRLVGLCDVDAKVLAERQSDNKDLFRETDMRRVLERDDVDAIVSATPNHWHALLTIWACQAGKHVFIEKPVSHNMVESQAMVAAARRYGRIVQGGFQNRSDETLRPFFENLAKGDYGRVLSVHGTCHRSRASIGKQAEPLEVPSHIDYQLWLGPAEDQPLLRPRLHYDWHWDFNTGNGDVGNQGPHEWDMMNWALGDRGLPQTMRAAGNRFAWNDAGDTPNIMACEGESSGIPVRFEVMDLKHGRRAPYGKGVGVIVETEKGVFVGGRGGGSLRHPDGSVTKFDRNRDGDKPKNREVLHMENFAEAIVANDPTKLQSEIAIAARSSSMAHMANISYQMGRRAEAQDVEAAFSASVAKRDMVARLRESTMIHALKTKGEFDNKWNLGPQLSYDAAAQAFTGDQAEGANQLMTRRYRKGFELPSS